MSLPRPLYDMCRQSVTIEPYSTAGAHDGYGAPEYGTAVEYRARIVNKSQLVIGRDGNEVASRTVVWLADDVQVDPRSRVTLPASAAYSNGDYNPKILAVEYYPDAVAGGLTHTKIYL